jgi:signal transduction histidine kinase
LRSHRIVFRAASALLALAVLIGLSLGARAAESPTKRVLVISTGSRLSPGFNVVDQQILQALRTIKSAQIDTYAENLDITRFPAEGSQRIFREYLAARYAEQRPDLVILVFVGTLGDTARSLTQVFPATPILVGGFTEEQIHPEQLGELVSGFVERTDAHAALELMLRLQPKLRRIVVIGGTSAGDREKLRPIRVAAAAFADKVAVEFWDNLAMAELRRAVTALPPDTAILYTPLFRDATGQTFVSAEVGRWIGQSASVPVYLTVDQSFGTGAIGGIVSSVEAFGQRVGEQARRVMTGAPLSSVPFEVRSDGVPTFDWRALQRWNIGEDVLPSGSVVRFKPPSLWREYGPYVAGALAIIALQSASIVALMLERRRRRRIDAVRERTALELQQQRTQLAHVGRVSLMGELAASLAHELSQPLTAIFANARAALRYLDQRNSAESREALEDLLKDQSRAAEVLRHMRGFVRKESPAEYKVVSLVDMVRDVVALVRSDAAMQRVDVISDIPADLPAVRGDRVHLQQVLLNLLLNAFDAMAATASEVRAVTITAETLDGTNRVAVADRGRGMPVQDLKRAFEPFYTTKPEGLGMGLSICSAIIRAHGGSLWAENNEHGGATFYFTVPVATA